MMPEAFDRWWNEFKYESPWYFWVYSLLMPLGFFFLLQQSISFYLLISQGMAAWLLKKWGFLEKKWLYALSIVSFFAAMYLEEMVLGDSMNIYLLKKYDIRSYPFEYNVIVYSLLAAMLAFICVYCVKRKALYALQASTCLFFLLMAGGCGLILVGSAISLCFAY